MIAVEPEALDSLRKNHVILDVRTPAEFQQGQMPGAFNLPLFSNEERIKVGTTYKQVDPETAFAEALGYVGPKMRQYVDEAKSKVPDRKILVHCWRGGQRSNGMGWLLDKAGFDVKVLKGGYKNYRRYCREELMDRGWRFVVIGGPTGCGKTELLYALRKSGEQIIDLEGLARHKGSAFGGINQEPQPTNEQFENDLYFTLEQLDPQKRIWLENESLAIGKVHLPAEFFNQFKSSPIIQIDLPAEQRVNRLVVDYGKCSKEELIESFEKIAKRLGGQHAKSAVEHVREARLAEACEIALKYYDKAYEWSTAQHQFENEFRICGTEVVDHELADRILTCARQNGI